MVVKIIFVDDEYRVLDGLKRSLHDMRDKWDMSFASSGQEALELMANTKFDVIVSDMDMPAMSGDVLLNRVMIESPETVRIVLTGAATQESVFRLVGSDHYFLSKPCPKEVFIRTVEKALSHQAHVVEKATDERPNGHLNNEELTQVFEEFFRMQLLKGAIAAEDVPSLMRARLSEDLINFFAPEVEASDHLTQFLEGDEYDDILNGWLDADD